MAGCCTRCSSIPGAAGGRKPAPPLTRPAPLADPVRARPDARARQNNFIPGRTAEGDYATQVIDLKVVASAGFTFREHQLHGNTKRVKPGW